jgi:hypothetical protein
MIPQTNFDRTAFAGRAGRPPGATRRGLDLHERGGCGGFAFRVPLLQESFPKIKGVLGQMLGAAEGGDGKSAGLLIRDSSPPLL